MSVTLYHHPFSRAANVVWMLEELGMPYELRFVDIMQGEHKKAALTALNPMGKLPILTDGDAVVTEQAAIGVYLADKYALGRLAPGLDDPKRATYLRWAFFAPSVIEPGSMAKHQGWEFRASAAGWGEYETMMRTMAAVVRDKHYILGNEFSMADCIFGGAVRYMLMFKMIDPLPELVAYAARLAERPAAVRAQKRNEAVIAEHGLGKK